MAKTLIGNIKGKNGRGITSIKKTGTTGSVDTYTITYTDSTTSTFTINNADSISLQRQIVPSAAVESSAIASQAYVAGDYVVVNGVLRKVKRTIAKGNTISDSNSTATTVTGELVTLGESASKIYDADGVVVIRGRSHVVVSVYSKLVDIAANDSIQIPYTLPVGSRPMVSIGNSCTASLEGAVNLRVEPNGSILLSTTFSNRGHGYIFVSVTYPV